MRRGRRRVRPCRFLVVGFVLWGCGDAGPGVPSLEPGEPFRGLDSGDRGRFFLGRALFERLATVDEGLGPLYNAQRCSSCHDQPVTGGGGTRVLVLKATRFADGTCDRLESEGGDNIQRRTTDLMAALGWGPEEIPGSATDTVRVTAPPLLGLGLVEAVPDSVLEEIADPGDLDGDGISGRLPRLANGGSARFGRKGDASTLEDFVDTALRFELGFTTPGHLAEETRNGVPLPPEVDPAADPEIDGEALGILVAYIRFLAPPDPEVASSPAARDTVSRGAALFGQIGCTSCHRETVRTGRDAHPVLANRTIRPYSDFLLHDLGAGLADVCGVDAAPGELRTAPLWGIRYRDRLLHDGRAETVTAAISAHGGEAVAARDAFAALPAEARTALVRFLKSL